MIFIKFTLAMKKAVTANEQEAESFMLHVSERDYDSHDNVPHIPCKEF